MAAENSNGACGSVLEILGPLHGGCQTATEEISHAGNACPGTNLEKVLPSNPASN